MASGKIDMEAVKHLLREDIDRIATLIGATVSAIATIVEPTPLTPLIPMGQLAIALLMAYRLGVSYRQAHKLFREKHLPVIVAIGCRVDEFNNMVSQALKAVRKYDFDAKLYLQEYNLREVDFTDHHMEWLPGDPQSWMALVRRVRERVRTLDSRILGRKVYHFFLRAPIAFSIGLGATLGTQYEFFFHHYQPGAGEDNYHPVLQVTREKTRKEGVHILKTRVRREEFQYLQATPKADGASEIVYVA
ncbi:MAG: hypothetical protein ACK4OK_10285, partial [Thermoflexus sp.]